MPPCMGVWSLFKSHSIADVMLLRILVFILMIGLVYGPPCFGIELV